MTDEAVARPLPEHLAHQLLVVMNDAVIVTDTDLDEPGPRITYVNPAFTAMTGWSAAEVVGQSPRKLQAEGIDRDELRRVRRELEAGRAVRFEVLNRRKDGTTFFVEIDVTPVRDTEGALHRFLSVQREVTGGRAEAAELRLQALHDEQTGLLNRRGVLRVVRSGLGEARRGDGPQPALVLLDVAGLRRINNSLGRAAGDEVVEAIGRRVVSAVGAAGVVGRLESGEFVLVTGDGDLPRLIGLCERIRRALIQPVRTASREVPVSLGLGLAIAGPEHEPEDLVREADLALRAAKQRGPGQYELYDASLGRAVQRRLDLEAELRVALTTSELVLHYQPVVDLDGGRTHHCEALLRWFRDGRVVASPAEFVPVAEETGLVATLGVQAMHGACVAAAAWQDRLPGVGVAVNLSPRQLSDPALLSEVDRALDCPLPADLVTLEVTESALMEDPRAASSTLQALRRRGLHLALDDFGTGYSSLAHLSRLPVDSVKVDKAFVDHVTHDPTSRAVLRAVVSIAGDLGLDVVAEGIETPEQCEAVAELGVRLGQGYLFSRPVPAQDLPTGPDHPE